MTQRPFISTLPARVGKSVASLAALLATMPAHASFLHGDTLAKVAELIGLYDGREVLIIGHSDARGDAARNRQLSERRAERVKQILVNSFEIEADRLSTEGLGDTLPIASNATPEGRRANRRVRGCNEIDGTTCPAFPHCGWTMEDQ